MGIITSDDFTNADILEATYPAVAKRLHSDWVCDPAIPIVTGFLGKVFLMPYILAVLPPPASTPISLVFLSFTLQKCEFL